ncbi:hypothetical protein BS78_07G040500 [Paspalum vaginatum]|nr:hypothetical protein BS78_07G040500 [Paspalum vaginatum]
MASGAVAAAMLMLLMVGGAGAGAAAAATTRRRNACTRICGNISVPFPFGIEPGCYHATGFNLTCSHSYRPPRLFLGDAQVLEISIPNAMVFVRSSLHSVRIGDQGLVNRTWVVRFPQRGSYPYSLSVLDTGDSNLVLDEMSCTYSQLVDNNSTFASCTAASATANEGVTIAYSFYNIDVGYSFYNIQIRKLEASLNGDGYSFFVNDRGIYNSTECYNRTSHKYTPPPDDEPELVTLSWIISSSDSFCLDPNVSAPECRSANSSCLRDDVDLILSGYTCRCSEGFHGNPYIAHGPRACQDIDECTSPERYHCYGDCKNTQGSFICLCPAGYEGNSSVPNGCKDIDECDNPEEHSCYGTCQNFPGSFQCQCPNGTYGNPYTKDGCVMIKRKNSFIGLSIGLGVGSGTSLFLALGAPFIIRKIKLQKLKKMREKLFNQNHGLLLQQLISHNADIGERMIITLRELQKATNNFDRARVIGGGGHGIVFKGIIGLQVVAIKKSKFFVQREIDQFINEVAVLSQLNHRNVVKLLGCCLEVEVPLLIYEFVSNGTLYQHLHVEGSMSLAWVDRKRIALEVARALSYLHSAASMPIFHRDIKSSNILLDDNLIAKVSDFGASRYIPIDQTGIATDVQGTIGYLDPMYYYTGRLTDKSDVFSFGVLLIELLTRKQPFLYQSNDDGSLVSHFIKLVAEGNLVDIIDPQVIEEEEEEDGEVQEVATIASTCTKLRREDRPTMREVEITLENLLARKQHVPCIISPRSNEDETLAQYMPTERITNEASRQHTMEEEIMLSASYPR